MPKPWIIWSASGLFVLIGALAIILVPRLLIAEWLPNASASDQRASLGYATQAVLFTLGGLIAVIGVSLSLVRHREELRAAERDNHRLELDKSRDRVRREEFEAGSRAATLRELRARFVTAVELLSDQTAPTKRRSGLYALAALSDDWDSIGSKGEAQVCIDVICSYLRASVDSEVSAEEVDVRRTGFNLISDRLRDGAPHSWSDRRIDVSGAHINFTASFRGTRIGAAMSFDGCRLTGDEGFLDFTGTVIEPQGRLIFDDADLGGRIRFTKARIHGAIHAQRARISGRIDFRDSKLHGIVNLAVSVIEQPGQISFRNMRLKSSSSIRLTLAQLHGGVFFGDTVSVGRGSVGLFQARVKPGGLLSFRGVAEQFELDTTVVVVESGGVLEVPVAK